MKKSLARQGYVGQTLTIECSGWDVWTNTESNSKYFCNSPCNEKNHIIATVKTGDTTTVNRIKLQNKGEKGLFVTFIDLQKWDANTYFCGLSRVVKDSFIQVTLKVLDGKFILN